ncbi:MAG: hypothetical protein ACK4S5_00420 [Sphingobium yanoikuyae]
MGMVQHIETAFSGRNDKVVSALVAGLEREFGRGAAEGLARHFLEAEEVDFRWDARSEERWLGIERRRAMGCSMRTDRQVVRVERRRRFGAVFSLFSRRNGKGGGGKGKQDKGSVSRPCLSDCLHILFLKDSGDAARDSRDENGGNLPFLARNCETQGRRGV